MINDSKVVKLCLGLSQEQRRKFKRQLQRQGSKRQTTLIRLFDQVVKTSKSPTPKWDIDSFVSRCMPKDQQSEASLRHHLSYLFKAVKAFLIEQEIEHHDHLGEVLYVKALRRLGLNSLCQQAINKQLSNGNPLGSSKHVIHYELYKTQSELLTTQRRFDDLRLQEVVNQLDLNYVSSLLMEASNLYSHARVSPRTYKLPMLDDILERIPQDDLLKNDPVVQIWRSTLLMDRDDDAHAFETLHTRLLQEPLLLSLTDTRQVLLSCINFCIRKANKGERAFIQTTFDLYKMGIESEALLIDGYLSKFTFRNICNHGLALDETAWVETFLEEKKSLLHPRERTNTHLYNKARYHFYTKDLDTAQALLRDVDFDDMAYNVDARRLLTRIYLEKEEYEALDYHLDSFKAFLMRNKKTISSWTQYWPLVKFTRQLLNNLNKGKTRLSRIKDHINAHDIFVDQDWISAKVEQSLKR